MLRLGRTLLAGVGLAVMLFASTAAASGLQGSPASIDQTLKKSGDTLPPVTVTNPTDEAMDVVISFGAVAHDAFGSPVLDANDYKYGAPKLFSVKEGKFTLAAGASKQVVVTVNVPKGQTGGAYAAMYVLGSSSKKQASTIEVKVRMAVILEITLPGEVKHAIGPVGVFGMQDSAGGPITLYAQVQNNGTVHDVVGGSIVVADAKGAQVAKVALDPAAVFPGLVRGLRGTWNAPATLAAGKYKLTAAIAVPGGTSMSVSGELVVMAPGDAAREKVSITKFALPPAVQKKALAFEAAITNQGNIPLTPTGRVIISDDKGKEITRVAMSSAAAIAASAKGTVTGSLPAGLPIGKYGVRLEVVGSHDLVLGVNSTALQILDKDPNVTAKITKFVAPSDKVPYVTLELSNTGNADLDAEGIILIADSSGNIVNQVVLEKRTVAAGKATSYQLAVPKLDSGLYELRATAKFGGPAPATATTKYFVP